MPTSGFEVRGRIIRRRSLRFASVHLELTAVVNSSVSFVSVRQSFVGVAVRVALKTTGQRAPN
jgi:hypothetical protein